jgi:hypothetical protein
MELLQRWQWSCSSVEEHGRYTLYWISESSAVAVYEKSLDFPDALAFFTHQIDNGRFAPAHRQILMFLEAENVERNGPWPLFHYMCQDLGQLGKRFLNSYAEVAFCRRCQSYRVYTHEEPVSGQGLERTQCTDCAKRPNSD